MKGGYSIPKGSGGMLQKHYGIFMPHERASGAI